MVKVAIVFGASFSSYHAASQNLTHLEYFFDTDPGIGNGTQILVTVPADSITLNTTINTGALTTGYHVLFIRSKLSNGKWSLYQPREFFIKQPAVAAEYFFDTDPGVGFGIPLTVFPGIDSTVITTGISTAGLPTGPHALFIRTRDASGHWSMYEQREFFIKQSMVAAEYFFDTDPGVGNGTPLPLIAGPDSTQILTAVSTSGLTTGNHILFVRTKDASGHWSMYQPREFFIKQHMIAAEYFFDIDPGVGNGNFLPVTPSPDSTMSNASVPTSGLPTGNHKLFVRAKDASGHWSMYQPREFYIEKSIVAAEYFIDTDPGLGNAIPVPVTAGNSINFNTSVSVGALPFGPHFLFVRTKDDAGIWSLHEPQQFTVGSPLPVQWLGFDAVRQDRDALLTWETGSEINCDKFEIERMDDENQQNGFIKIGEVAGHGNSTVTNSYHFTDRDVKNKGTVYYRVKQVDYDGEYSHTRVVAVSFDTKPVIRLFPNPTSDFFTFDAPGNEEVVKSIEVFNGSGELVNSVSNPGSKYQFGMDFTAGTYFVAVKMADEVMQFQVIKSR